MFLSVLPELPIPGPAAHANSEPGSALLYHRSLVDEASQLLATPANEELMAKLNSAISATSGIVQGGPSALGKRYVDSKFEVAFSSKFIL